MGRFVFTSFLIILMCAVSESINAKTKKDEFIFVSPEEITQGNETVSGFQHIDVSFYFKNYKHYHRTEAMLHFNESFTINIQIDETFVKSDPLPSQIVCNDTRLNKICVNATIIAYENNKHKSLGPWEYYANVSKTDCDNNGQWDCQILSNSSLRKVKFDFWVTIQRDKKTEIQEKDEQHTNDSGDIIPIISDRKISEDSRLSSKEWILLCGVTGATVIIIIAVISLVVGVYKRKRILELAAASDVNYETLPAHNEGPMPIPSQWNDYSRPADFQPQDNTYCVPYVAKSLDAMYAKPVPKIKRNQPPASEPLYAEATQPEHNHAVATPTGGTDMEHASQDRGTPNAATKPGSLTNNRIIYAQVLPRALPKNAENNYAHVLPKSLRKLDTKYSNTFENQRYANAHNRTSDYAEPAYCESPN